MARGRKLVLAGIAAMPWMSSWVVVLDLLRPRHSYLRKVVRELGARGVPYGLSMDVCGFGMTGLLLLAFAVGYRTILKEQAHGWLLLLVTALLLVGTATPLTMAVGGQSESGLQRDLNENIFVLRRKRPRRFAIGDVHHHFPVRTNTIEMAQHWCSDSDRFPIPCSSGRGLCRRAGPGSTNRLFFSWFVPAAVFLPGVKQRDVQPFAAGDRHPVTRAAHG